MKSQIKLVFFDLGGVFFEWDRAFQSVCRKFDLDFKQFVHFFGQHEDSITRGVITPAGFWQLCQQNFNLKDGQNFDFVTSWLSDLIPIPQSHAFAEKISNQYRLGVISNTYQDMFPLLVEKKIVPNLPFEPRLLSCQIGLKKPEAEIYQLAQEKAGLKPEQILFIDDTPSCIQGAADLGWQTCLFQTRRCQKSIEEIEKLLF